MADGVAYPTQDHVATQSEWAEPPYVDPNEARKAQLRAELDQLEAASRPVETPAERAARLTAELADLEAETEPTPESDQAKVDRLEAELEAARATKTSEVEAPVAGTTKTAIPGA
jgi:chromosome segregation ATPase